MQPAQIGRLELAIVSLVSAALAIVCTWPLAPDLRSRIPNTLVDSPYKAWEVGWIGHAIREHPLDLYDANAFWPRELTLAFSDAMIGTAPLTMFAVGFRNSLAAYNLLFLVAFALAFIGAYLLARELGTGPAGGLVAGAAFAFAPWRFAQASHLHVLMSGGIAVSLFLLLRGYRLGRPVTILAGWLVAAWQLAMGFTLGLQFAYLLAALGLVLGVPFARRSRVDRGIVVATAAGAAAFLVAGVLLALPYLEIADEYPQSRRTHLEVAAFSPMPWSFASAPESNVVWGAITSPVRETLRVPDEQSLFPGLATVALAVLGLSSSVFARRPRFVLTVGVVVTAALSLGLHPALGRLEWLLPYRYVFEFAPGWDGIRTPGRIFTLTSLGLALLAAAGASAVISRTGRRGTLVGGAIATVIVIEGFAGIAYPTVPPVPVGQAGLGAPQLHLPTEAQRDSLYMLWSTDAFPPLVNGYPGFELPPLERLRRAARSFPSRVSVAALRSYGVRVVVFHPELARETPWEGMAERRVEDERVTVRRGGGVVAYLLSG